MLKNFFYFILVISVNYIYAQKVEYKFYRPSIIQGFTNFNDEDIKNDLYNIVNQSLNDKIDLIKPTSPIVNNINFPAFPKKKIFKTKKNKLEIEKFRLEVQRVLNEPSYEFTRQAISTWFNRNEKGLMDEKYINKMGNYTAVKQDINIDNMSEISRLGSIGYDLIGKTYVIIYRVKSIKSWKEIYDEIDNNLKKKSEKFKFIVYKPILRKNVGYILDYEVYVMKMDWNKDIETIFYKNYYVDEYSKKKDEKESISKINAFKNLKINSNLTGTYDLNSESSIDIYAPYYIEQTAYYLTNADIKLSGKTKSTPVKIDYLGKGDKAKSEGYYGAAIMFYNKAINDNPKDKTISAKRTEAQILEAELFQRKEKEKYEDLDLQKKLKADFTEIIQKNTYLSISKDKNTNSDFQVTTTISSKGLFDLKVPIGTKEGLEVGEKFIAYELEKVGDKIEKRYIGYCRSTKKMNQNKDKISGVILNGKQEFKPYSTGNSIFIQQAGKKLTPGTILISEPDKGDNIRLEYSLGKNSELSKKPYSYMSFGYSINARKIWEFFEGSKKMGPENIYTTLHMHHFMNNDSIMQLESKVGIGLSIEKEIYVGLSGLHLVPYIYGGYPIIMNFGCGIGYNFNKNMAIGLNSQLMYIKSFGLNFKYRF
jgi:hypothetical protein